MKLLRPWIEACGVGLGRAHETQAKPVNPGLGLTPLTIVENTLPCK
ncbi:MAG: hypothetical protein ACO2O0_07660 [Desulfurococcales archaeon]